MFARRRFLAGIGALAMVPRWPLPDSEKFRAVVIGHTGKGDYGHGLDLLFQGRADVELVAVADPDDAGRLRAAQRCGAKRSYADWRTMLTVEKPELVSIAPRQTPGRLEMFLGALNAGAHVICEKPFVRTPAQADQVLSLARRENLQIAVMHQMRLSPAIVHLKNKLDQGLIGNLLAMHAWGKQDHRSGGEDLLVLGVHLFDLMRLFAGDPFWCTARVLEKGHEARPGDARLPTEDLGPVLGDEIDAQFSFGNGVLGTFTSRQRLRDITGHWGIELVGSTGCARILADIWPRVLVRRSGQWTDSGRTDQWLALEDDPSLRVPADQRTTSAANARVVDDWLGAIRENRQPVCSGLNGAKAVEMVMAVWQAALCGQRVGFPLSDRGHPLEHETGGQP